MANGPVFPRVHAMIVCDRVARADQEGKVHNLTGARTEIRASSFPYSHPQLWVYLQSTGHSGVTSYRLALTAAGADAELLSTAEHEVEFHGPLEVIVLARRIRNCTFPRPGLYYVQAYFGDKLVNERLLVLSEGTVLGNGEGS